MTRRALVLLPFPLLALLAAVVPLRERPIVPVHVTGAVTSRAGGTPVVGALVQLEGTTAAAQTDARGRYALDAKLGDGDPIRLDVRAIGFERVRRTVEVTRDTVVVHVALAPAQVRLSEVTVTATDAAAAAPMSAPVPVPMPAMERAQYRGVAGGVAASIAAMPGSARHDPAWNTEEYATIDEQGFVATRSDPRSTFGADVDRASYANVRRFLVGESRLPPADAVRIEELVNYFPYAYPEPRGEHPIAIATEVARAPWAPEHLLVRIGLRTPRIELAELPPSNLVFLLDVSGSMNAPNKLPLVQRSLRLLVQELRPQDRVAIVVYAGAAGLVLPSTPASEKERILDAIDRLEAGGSTAGGAGIRLAYDVAREARVRGGTNRVVLATDGDFNVGVSSTAELVRLVETRREEGTFLTVLGFGMGNLKDAKLEQLADRGNGNYAYIDDLLEARKVLVEELGGTLATVAKDVKLQVEFNPRHVRAHRLIGYENRRLAHVDFTDDRKDAGDLGAGHSVTALYELVPVGARTAVDVREAPPLRYQDERAPSGETGRDELLAVSVRYKQPDGVESRLLRHVVGTRVGRPSSDFAFASAVAGFGMLLRESPHAGTLGWAAVRELAAPHVGDDPDGYRRGFLDLVDAAARLSTERTARREP